MSHIYRPRIWYLELQTKGNNSNEHNGRVWKKHFLLLFNDDLILISRDWPVQSNGFNKLWLFRQKLARSMQLWLEGWVRGGQQLYSLCFLCPFFPPGLYSSVAKEGGFWSVVAFLPSKHLFSLAAMLWPFKSTKVFGIIQLLWSPSAWAVTSAENGPDSLLESLGHTVSVLW